MTISYNVPLPPGTAAALAAARSSSDNSQPSGTVSVTANSKNYSASTVKKTGNQSSPLINAAQNNASKNGAKKVTVSSKTARTKLEEASLALARANRDREANGISDVASRSSALGSGFSRTIQDYAMDPNSNVSAMARQWERQSNRVAELFKNDDGLASTPQWKTIADDIKIALAPTTIVPNITPTSPVVLPQEPTAELQAESTTGFALQDFEKPRIYSIMSDQFRNSYPARNLIFYKYLESLNIKTLKINLLRRDMFISNEFKIIKSLNNIPQTIDPVQYELLYSLDERPPRNEVCLFIDENIEPNHLYAYKIELIYESREKTEEEERFIEQLTTPGTSTAAISTITNAGGITNLLFSGRLPE